MLKSSSAKFLITVISLSFFLTACGSAELGEPLTRDYETYVGEFASLGSVKVNPVVTHLFETEDGDILYAYSDRYNLDEYTTPMEAYGVLSTYEGYDKPFFEVKRLTEVDETLVEDEEVTEVEYRSNSMGALTTIYSNWTVEENSPTWVSFVLPLPSTGASEEAGEAAEKTNELLTPDTIDWVLFTDALTTSSESSEDERATEIRSYVLSNYEDLANVEGELTHVGPDQVLGIRYKTATGDIFIFVPRASDLLEMSYHYLFIDDALRIQHTNLFSNTLNKFRFIPDDGSELETTEPAEEDEEVGEPLDTNESQSSVTQVSISKFATLSSSSFGFSMSYPANWYYSGGSTGYAFDDEAIEDPNDEAIMKLNFNATTYEGIERGGPNISVTKKVDSRYYTLVGPAEYETVMEMMLNSIQTINE